jgi:hypothetical protein
LLVGVSFELLGFRDGTLGDIVGGLLLGFDIVEATLVFGGRPDGRRRNVVSVFVLGLEVLYSLLEVVDGREQPFENTRKEGWHRILKLGNQRLEVLGICALLSEIRIKLVSEGGCAVGSIVGRGSVLWHMDDRARPWNRTKRG